ncbi:MAG: sigma-70 family RNA polymerase sigma factor [Candidatus Aenigmarchaeota archaeon]|nr:sigma-70 family RNA polymerase sigma factor [Candidatus Aenigmarchaeota archaeon]
MDRENGHRVGYADLLGLYDEIHTYLRHRVRCEHAAEDLTQEVFLRALRQYDTRGPPDNPPAWLKTVARNVAVDYVRSRVLREQDARLAGRVVDAEGPGDTAERREELDRLERVMEDLPSEARTLLRERYLEGRSRDELADVRGITKNALGVRLYRARRSMRDSW